MSRFQLSLSIFATALSLFLASPPAQALNLVSFLSDSGNNGNPCSIAEPCRSISGAVAKTEPGGEIICLDGYYDENESVTKPVTIDCGVANSSITGVGSNALTINLNEATYPNGVVTLRNLNFNGHLGNTDGIHIIGGGAAVHVENCTIQGFADQGIDFAPSSSVDLYVRDTIISNNSNGGVLVHPATAAGARGSLSNVRLDQNRGFGLAVVKPSGAGALIAIDDTQVERNTVGVRANGVRASILLSGSTVTHNTTGIQVLNSGEVVSSGNNTVHFNTTDGAPTTTIPLK